MLSAFLNKFRLRFLIPWSLINKYFVFPFANIKSRVTLDLACYRY